jgi:hypothetical protein
MRLQFNYISAFQRCLRKYHPVGKIPLQCSTGLYQYTLSGR